VRLHPGLQVRRNLLGRPEQAGRAGDVEERLVDAQRLDQRRELVEHAEHLVRLFPVPREVPRDDRRVRAEPLRDRHRLRRVTAEHPRLVRRRGHDAPRPVVPDEHRPPAEGRVVELLDGGEERVHVDVEDGPRRRLHHAIVPRLWSPLRELGKGEGEGLRETARNLWFRTGPHPDPLPEYRERGAFGTPFDLAWTAVTGKSLKRPSTPSAKNCRYSLKGSPP
jgi:hypothetical protein